MATLFVEKLVNLDFTYLDLARGLVGETLLVDFILKGPQNEQGMVLDFGDVKRKVVKVLEDAIDHKLVLPLNAQTATGKLAVQVATEPSLNDHYQLTLESQRACYQLRMPAVGFAALDLADLAPVTLANYLHALLREQGWWRDLWQVELKLYHESVAKPGCTFSYSHGLPKHLGACQRIAHGHRSKMEIYINGIFDQKLTQQWCQRWADIYIGSCLDLQDETPEHYTFAYQSAEGHSRLQLPKHCAYLIETESTIEHIAQHLADSIAGDPMLSISRPVKGEIDVKTRVYEGYNKGAEGHAQVNSAHTGQ